MRRSESRDAVVESGSVQVELPVKVISEGLIILCQAVEHDILVSRALRAVQGQFEETRLILIRFRNVNKDMGIRTGGSEDNTVTLYSSLYII